MKYLLLLLFPLWLLSPVAAQWEPMHGPFGGIILDLAKNDDHQFAATSNGIYISADGGKNWNHSPFDHDIKYSCNEIGVHGNLVVARAYQTNNDVQSIHYFKSGDSGNTWQELSLPQGVGADQIAINEYGIYFKSSQNIWVSVDLGNSWVQSQLPMNEPYTYPLYSYDGHIFTGAYNVIYQSDGNADNWKTITIDSMEEQIGTIHVFDSIIFVRSVENEKIIYRSADYGETWTTVAGIDWGFWNACFAKVGNAFIGSAISSFYISDDLGASWQPIATDNYIPPLNMMTLADTILAGSFGPGILVSTDVSQTYIASNQGLDAAYASHITSDSDFIWAANAFGGVWKQDRLSGEWENINTLHGLNVLDIKTQDQNVFVLDENHELYTSSDHGVTWINITPQGTFYTEFTEITIDGPNVMVGGNVDGENSAIRTTQDTGRTWNPLIIVIADEVFFPSLFARTPTAIFASEIERKFRSLDNGATWQELYFGPFFDSGCIHCGFVKMFSAGEVLYLLEADSYYYSTRLHASFDQGDSWEVVDFGYPETGFNAGFSNYATSGNSVFGTDVNQEERGIHVSFDAGKSSITFHEGLPTSKISMIHSDDHYLYASTAGFGIWRRKIEDLQLLGTSPSPSENQITLYPNPSNGYINLQLDSFTSGSATVIIRDTQGKPVTSTEYLIEGHLEISTHSLPSGLYLLTLITGKELYTGKFFVAQ
jgi:photosystem II stability/assembly factor-like uncharacterized protein